MYQSTDWLLDTFHLKSRSSWKVINTVTLSPKCLQIVSSIQIKFSLDHPIKLCRYFYSYTVVIFFH